MVESETLEVDVGSCDTSGSSIILTEFSGDDFIGIFDFLQNKKALFFLTALSKAIEQVMSDQDSEDEVDDDIADFEDRRMLDDLLIVSKDEKQLMHLWNSFVRWERWSCGCHVPWACEAFSRLHGRDLVLSPARFVWCWRLFMIKLWNHGLLDGCTMNNCNLILERCQMRDQIS
ncbi:polycomb group protein EMBRYONIC FLOWER 2-like [Pistacia vera]|uniref:polycomb group protein EMBRYONIC FLOWER 2-like n=1 Tax=Pistacia vera TaxID=55513 RepID=UPI0012630CED|nr:polycomb group protein EMBRYONIC FLOWER 2-like [Pistacia vera]